MRLALVASMATGAMLSMVGTYLVIRRVVFLGLVLASAATVGAAIAQVFAWPPELASIAATVATALGLGTIRSPRRISAESVMGWAYAAATAATVLILAGTAGADLDTLGLLYGNLLTVSKSHATGLVALAVVIGAVQIPFGRRFLLVTFDPEAASVAGVNAALWSLSLNLLIGVVAAAAVHEIGALLTFSVLTLAPAASLLASRSIRSTFAVSATLGVLLPCLGIAVSFYLDLPPGPAGVALLALCVPVASVIGRWRDTAPRPD
ncbi:MAG TPA: metal ABC transporter permease [Bryobacteraceae bacterium]|nr:metal ABC transporter permease [Bryobacteraceae bacterium]